MSVRVAVLIQATGYRDLTPPPLVRFHSIILIFAQQANRILDNIGSVFRVFVPMCVYFIVMWTGTFFLVYYLTSRKEGSKKYGYKMAVVQSFTAGSNK